MKRSVVVTKNLRTQLEAGKSKIHLFFDMKYTNFGILRNGDTIQ